MLCSCDSRIRVLKFLPYFLTGRRVPPPCVPVPAFVPRHFMQCARRSQPFPILAYYQVWVHVNLFQKRTARTAIGHHIYFPKTNETPKKLANCIATMPETAFTKSPARGEYPKMLSAQGRFSTIIANLSASWTTDADSRFSCAGGSVLMRVKQRFLNSSAAKLTLMIARSWTTRG